MVLQCAVSTLADYYVEGPYTIPPVARSALANTFVSSGNLTLPDYANRSEARIAVSRAPSFFDSQELSIQFTAVVRQEAVRRQRSWHLQFCTLLCFQSLRPHAV